MECATKWLQGELGGADIDRMPHNNPGYDIRVRRADDSVLYVEVKGTVRPLPHFYMSEGERRFAEDQAEKYRLLVVYSIDREARIGTVLLRAGALGGADVELQPTQWEGSLALEMLDPHEASLTRHVLRLGARGK